MASALVLYRVMRMRMRMKAKGRSAGPRTALDLLERIRRHVARNGPATKTTLTRHQPEQHDIFEALSLKKNLPETPILWQNRASNLNNTNYLRVYLMIIG